MRSTMMNCAFALLLAAGAASADNGRLRVVHASPDAPAVDVYVDGAKVLEALPYKEYSEYLPLPAGAHEIRVNVTGTQTTVLQAAPSVEAGRDYTAIAVGFATKAPALSLILLADDNSLPDQGQIKLRAIHAAASAPAVDIYVTTPFETLDGKTPVLKDVPFAAASGYLSVPPPDVPGESGRRGHQEHRHRFAPPGDLERGGAHPDCRGRQGRRRAVRDPGSARFQLSAQQTYNGHPAESSIRARAPAAFPGRRRNRCDAPGSGATPRRRWAASSPGWWLRSTHTAVEAQVLPHRTFLLKTQDIIGFVCTDLLFLHHRRRLGGAWRFDSSTGEGRCHA